MTQPASHSSSKPNQPLQPGAQPPVPMNRSLSPLEVLRNNMTNPTGNFMSIVASYYRGDKDEARRFAVAAVEYVRKVPKLMECDPASLMAAFVTSAQFRFLPSGVGGEAFVIPYGGDAKFQLGYQGIVTLLWRTGQIKSIKSLVVFDNERFEYEEGLETRLIHVPTKPGEKRGKPIAVYSVAHTINGGVVFQVMTEEQVMAIKAMSKAANKPDSPWNSKDPEKWMWKKTCLIQMAKLLPKTTELQQAIEKDYEVEADRSPIDPGGIGVGTASHAPDEQESPPDSEKTIQ